MSKKTFHRYRSYLLLLARLQLDDRRWSRVEASDVVQQTLLEAHAMPPQADQSVSGTAGWLRRALANNIRDAIRRSRRKKRDVAREIPFDQAIDGFDGRIASCLNATALSPSEQAVRAEDLLRLADAMEQLPEVQRQVIILHHLQGASLREAAERIGRTEGAVAGLLHRGLRKLREALSKNSQA
ncbi:MAG: sigma-70 family RNA polymerase sigma factor [Pirellulales bacterium]